MHGTYETPEQGFVSQNYGLDPGDVQRRKENATKLPQDSFPGGADPLNHVIEKGDPLFAPNRACHTAAHGKKFRGKPYVFTSFNGVPFGNAPTSAAVLEHYYLAGFSRNDHIDPGKRESAENKSGVAALVAGSMTMRYRGSHVTHPGDRVAYSLPDLYTCLDDPRAPKPKYGDNPGRLVPILETVDPLALDMVEQQLYVELVEQVGPEEPLLMESLQRLHDEQDKNTFTRRERAALAGYKLSTLVIGMRVVEALVHRGLLSINTPSKAEQLPDKTNVLANPRVNEDYKPEDNGEENYRVTENHAFFKAGLGLEREHPTDTGAEIAEKMAQTKLDLLWLAELLGVAGDGRREKTAVSSDVVQTVHWDMAPMENAGHDTYAPFMSEPVSSAGDELQRMADQARFGASGRPIRQRNDLVEDYVRNARSHGTMRMQAMAEVRQQLNRTVVGTAMSRGDPHAADGHFDLLVHGAAATY